MIEYDEILNGLTTIRRVLNTIEVKGIENVKALAVADEHCRLLFESVQKDMQENQNESKEEVETF